MTRRELAGPLLVTLAAALAYGPTIDDYFLQDDFGVVWLMSQRSVADVPRWFVSSWMENIWGSNPDEIRPFPALSFQPALLWGAGSPVPHHVTTLLFHIATGVLVYAAARTAASLGPAAAAFAGVAFVLLPNQAETAAWITGRVDSISAFFYLASFLAYARWRAAARLKPGTTYGLERQYVWSLVWCFAALFSKQTAITLAPALVLYDMIVARRRLELSWTWARPYVPFVALTAAYLLLRYVVFADVVREALLTPDRIRAFLVDAAHHLARVAFGHETLENDGSRTAMVASLLLGLGWLAASRAGAWRSARGAMAYFAVVWTLIGIAPTLVAGYSSPRHVYQASIGWALALAIALDTLWHAEPRRWRRAVAGILAVALLAGYAVQLRSSIVDWGVRAAVSRKAVEDLEREARGAPDGTVILAGLSPRSWNYSIPFVARPPFTREDQTGRVSVISHSSLYCCPDFQWDQDTRRALREWSARPERPPVVAMRWNSRTGELRRLSDREDPYLRELVVLLLESGDRATLDGNINRMLEEFVAFHQAAS